MNIFEITIQRQTKNGWPVVVKYTKNDKFLPICRQGMLKLNSDDNFAELTAQLGQPKQYGTILGKALFYDDVRDIFVTALSALKGHNNALPYLHVLLYIETEDLKELRWEKLCAPLDGDWDFLALNQQIPFSLYIPAVTERLFPAIGRRDLHALIVAASPEGLGRFHLDPFDVEATVSSVKTSLGDIPSDVLAMIDGAIGPPSFDTLMKVLTNNDKYYTIIHLVCHGKLLANGETAIYLSNAQNQVEPVNATTLIDRLTNLRRAPHFAFLSTCCSASAAAEAEGGKGGLAQRLVRELGMPAVVAMTEPVSINTAQALATTFYQQLKGHGNVDLALVQANAGLQGRYDITVPALFSRLGGRPLFSDTPDRPLTEKEIQYGIERLQKLLPERAPILCQELTNQAAVLQRTLGTQTDVSTTEQQKALAVVSELSTKVLDLDFKALAFGNEVPAYDTRCPFRGLYPFREADSEFFCGREVLIKELQQKLAEHNFLPVLGASGSGKSSVVMAGLIPELQKEQPELMMAYMTPRSNPLAQLETSLLKVQNQPSVLLVDQFEELFTLCTDKAWRLDFIHQLLELAQKQKVIITMRADFWGECAPYPELRDLMEKRQKLIAPMTIDELHHAIEMQAMKVGLRFEVDLVNKILDDVEGEPGAMPLLQHALQELWLRRHGRWLLSSEYRAIGGVHLAIANTADEFYNKCSGQEKEIVKNIFLRLTRLDVDAVEGEKLRDTRQRVELENLTPVDGDEVVTKKLVNELASLRLVITSVNDVTQKQEVEVAHEALIRHWQKLKEWLVEDRNTLIARQTINTTAEEWEKYKFDDSYLVHQGGRLEEAEQLRQQSKLKLNKLENGYLNACLERRDRIRKEKQRERLIKILILIGAPSLTILLIVGLFALFIMMFARTEEVEDLIKSSSEELGKERFFDALIHNLQAKKKLDQLNVPDFFSEQPEFQNKLHKTLQQILIKQVKEINRIDKLTRVTFSDDGKKIATVSQDGTINLWDFQGNKLKTLPGKHRSTNVMFSYNAELIAITSENKNLQLWNDKENSLHVLEQNQQFSQVLFSPDSEKIAIISGNTKVKLWNRQGELVTSRQHNDVSHFSLSVDGNKIVSYSAKNQNLKFWNQDNSQIPEKDGVLKASFSTDGRKIATVHQNQIIKIWNMEGEFIKELPPDKSLVEIADISFSPDGKILLFKHRTERQNGVIKLWNTESAQVKNLSHDSEVIIYSFSPDSQRIVTADKNKTLKFWNLKGESIGKYKGYQSRVNSVSFSEKRQTIATGSPDSTVKLWSWNSQELKTLQHNHAIEAVKFSADGKTIASVTHDNTLHIWSLNIPEFRTLIGHTKGVNYVTFSPNSQMIATASTDNTAKLWNLEGTEIQKFIGHKDTLTSVSFSPDNNMIATASVDNTAKLWNLEGTEIQKFIGHKDTLTSVSFIRNDMIATASVDNTVKLWNLKGTEIQQLISYQYPLSHLSFSPDGKTIVAASDDNTIQGSTLEGKKIPEIKLNEDSDDSVIKITFRPDNTMIIVSEQGEIKNWSNSRQEQCRLRVRDSVYKSVSFSPNTKIIASADGDKKVRLWSLKGDEDGNCQLLETLFGHTNETTSVSFSADGQWLATASADTGKSVILWKLNVKQLENVLDKKPDELVTDACKLLGNYLENHPEQKDNLPCD